MSHSAEMQQTLFRVTRINDRLVFSAYFEEKSESELSESDHIVNLAWLNVVSDYYELSYPGHMVFSKATRFYQQHHQPLMDKTLERIPPDAKLILTAISERLSSPASSDFNLSHNLLRSLMPCLLSELSDQGPDFTAPVTSRWNSDKTCRLISCKTQILARFDPLALTYWVHAIIAATVRESGKRAYFHDAVAYLETHEGSINAVHDRRHQGCRYISLSVTHVADYLQQQSLAWLKQHAGLVNNMLTRLYRSI